MLLGSSASGTRRALVSATSELNKGSCYIHVQPSSTQICDLLPCVLWDRFDVQFYVLPFSGCEPNRELDQQVAIPGYKAARRPRLSPRAAQRAPYAVGDCWTTANCRCPVRNHSAW
eukprot:4418098-Amphidinium_carterae.1